MENESKTQDRPILIIGGGIAGPVLAYWLHKGGKRCVVLERAPNLRPSGQNIDIRGVGTDVITTMGLEQDVRGKTTTEVGVGFVDESNRFWASFPSVSRAEGGSFTAELEILRSDLAELLYKKTIDKAEWIFGDHVDAIEDRGDHVRVHFHKADTYREFSIVVGADGVGSMTRKLAFGEQVARESYHSLDQMMAFFSIPELDTGKWARWCSVGGGRSLLVRPNGKGGTTVTLVAMKDHDYIEKNFKNISTQEAKKRWTDLFSDVAWETPTFLQKMENCADFYHSETAQVRMKEWSSKRVVLVGDAAYCPTAVTGMGTSLGIAGAYILAGELCQQPDHVTAFREYERQMRGHVDTTQAVPQTFIQAMNPQNRWAVHLMRLVLGSISLLMYLTNVQKFFSSDKKAESVKLPEYKWPEETEKREETSNVAPGMVTAK